MYAEEKRFGGNIFTLEISYQNEFQFEVGAVSPEGV